MIHVRCEVCGGQTPRRETFAVRESVMCETCVRKFVDAPGTGLQQRDVTRNTDPTVCQWCEADSGTQPQGELAGLPVCESCEGRLRNWPFPTWIRASFVALVIAGIGSVIYNLRHVEGFFASRASIRAFKAGDLATAVERAKHATESVPEFPDYRIQADVFESLSLIAANRSAEALEKLRKIGGGAQRFPMVQRLLQHAEVGVAFDSGDYDQFLKLAKDQNQSQPNDRQMIFQLASAYACKYAATNDETFKQLADERLVALGKDQSDAEAEYRQRILFRLTTRRIISREEFVKEFPNGWKPEE